MLLPKFVVNDPTSASEQLAHPFLGSAQSKSPHEAITATEKRTQAGIWNSAAGDVAA